MEGTRICSWGRGKGGREPELRRGNSLNEKMATDGRFFKGWGLEDRNVPILEYIIIL